MLHLPGPSGLNRRFSDHYTQARSRFIEAVDKLGDACWRGSIPHPDKGPQGEPLALDYTWIGDRMAPRVLVTQSAVHGVEGFAGSAIQVDQLGCFVQSGVPENVAILHLHAVNPHGFAWYRRVNEDGVDLNRNFIDFSVPLPQNPDYLELRHLLMPPAGSRWETADKTLAEYQQAWGSARFHRAVSGGQYVDPSGLFYGGDRPSWSREVLEKLFVDLDLGSREYIGVVDLHTGLGPYGYGELICDHPAGSRGVELAKRWYGDSVTEPALGTSSSVPKQGLIDYAWQNAFGDGVCFLTLEFGSYPFVELMDVLRRDHALRANAGGSLEPEQRERLQRDMSGHFYPRARDWQEAVIFRSRQVIDQALKGLSEESFM